MNVKEPNLRLLLHPHAVAPLLEFNPSVSISAGVSSIITSVMQTGLDQSPSISAQEGGEASETRGPDDTGTFSEICITVYFNGPYVHLRVCSLPVCKMHVFRLSHVDQVCLDKQWLAAA